MKKIKAKRKDIQFVKKGQKEEQEDVRPITRVMTSGASVKPELDLRGERYEDAMARLEKYVDDALLQNYPRVTIIHGKVTGALRKGVEQFIKAHHQIKSSSIVGAIEGGIGVRYEEQ